MKRHWESENNLASVTKERDNAQAEIAALKERAEKADNENEKMVKYFQKIERSIRDYRRNYETGIQCLTRLVEDAATYEMAWHSEREANKGLLAAMGEKDNTLEGFTNAKDDCALHHVGLCCIDEAFIVEAAEKARSTTPQDAYARLRNEAKAEAFEEAAKIVLCGCDGIKRGEPCIECRPAMDLLDKAKSLRASGKREG